MQRQFTRAAAVLLVPLALAVLVTCSDSRAPTSADTPTIPDADLTAGAGAESNDVTAQGTLPLPVNQTFNGTATALRINQAGTGQDAAFYITNASNSRIALLAQHAGSGPAFSAYTTGTGDAARAEIANGNSAAIALKVKTSGLGSAGSFLTTGTGTKSATLRVEQAGNGPALGVYATGIAPPGPGDAARVEVSNAQSTANALVVSHKGRSGYAGVFTVENWFNDHAALLVANASGQSGSVGIEARSASDWAGQFIGKYDVWISASAGQPGLQVAGGTKNAVVSTTTGARALYTEESTEVWFTDYGFGKLQQGRARILLDPAFAQTVEVNQPYHVFVQSYGDAELIVRDRTPLGFVVEQRAGREGNAEFSYRVVAKRRGFEAKRLEPAPWADDAQGLAIGHR